MAFVLKWRFLRGVNLSSIKRTLQRIDLQLSVKTAEWKKTDLSSGITLIWEFVPCKSGALCAKFNVGKEAENENVVCHIWREVISKSLQVM